MSVYLHLSRVQWLCHNRYHATVVDQSNRAADCKPRYINLTYLDGERIVDGDTYAAVQCCDC